MRGPPADAGDGNELLDRGTRVGARFELQSPRGHLPCQLDDASGTRAHDAQCRYVVDVRPCDALGARREMRESRVRCIGRVAERRGEAPGERGSTFDGDLLAEYRAQRELEAVEGAGDAKARVSLHRRAEQLIVREARRYHIRPGGEVEEVAQPPEKCGQSRGEWTRQLHEERTLLRYVVDSDPPRSPT